MLGSYGLWDPLETRHADVAQEVSLSGSFWDVTNGGRYDQRPVLTVWLVALGFKLLGVSELAGRLPLALCGLLTLLGAYWVLRRLTNDFVAAIGALVLATTPTFLFQSRQLISDVIYYGSLVASIGGLAAFLWPSSGRRSIVDLAIGSIGLVIGFLAKGLMLGAVFPLLSFALAVALSWRTPNRGDGQVWAQAEGPDIEPETTVGQALQASWAKLVVGVAAAGAVIGALLTKLQHTSYMLLGGEFRKVAVPATFETTFKKLGFGFYPWFALVPITLALFVLAQRRDPSKRCRIAFTQMLVVVVSIAGYVVASLWAGYLGQIRYPALPWLAMGIGLMVYQAWMQKEPVHRLWGVLALGIILALHQDFFMYPQSLAFSHLIGAAKFPIELKIKVATRVFGLLFAVLVFLALGGVPGLIRFAREPRYSSSATKYMLEGLLSSLRRASTFWFWVAVAASLLGSAGIVAAGVYALVQPSPLYGKIVVIIGTAILIGAIWVVLLKGLRWSLRPFVWFLNLIGDGIRFVGGFIGGSGNTGTYWALSGVLAVVFAGWCALYLTPQLSLHLSNKALFQVFHRCRTGGEKLAQYQVSGRGAAYYNKGQVEQISNQSKLFELLRSNDRWFILIPANYLGQIDQAARQAQISYYVLDDRSSQYLLISNRLEGTCKVDRNPLRRYVLSKPPKPKKVITANFENKVRLLGYDVDDVVTRGGKFRITLYFHVLGRLPSNYKIFIHFDQPAHRFHGDHVPLGGKLATQYWLPGDYIVNPHDVEIPLITTPSGTYTMYMGFWLGSQRIKVVEGPNDGVNRVRLGTLRVR